MTESRELTGLVPFIEEMLPGTISALPSLYTQGVRAYVERCVAGMEDAEVDAFVRERLTDWRFRKPFARFYLKFIEQPGGLRERVSQALGALSLVDASVDFAERLWRVDRLLDDLDRDSMSSLYVFVVRYSETVEKAADRPLRRLEYLPSGHVEAAGLDQPVDGYRHFRLIPVHDPPRGNWTDEDASDWLQLEDRMVDVVVSHLGTREPGLDVARAAPAAFPSGSGLARFRIAADETVLLLRRVLDLVEIDSLVW